MRTTTSIKNGVNGLSELGECFIDFLNKFYEKKGIGSIRNNQKIVEACKRMEEAHEGQKRKNGHDYVIHPYTVAKIYCLAHGKRISESGIIAALLHDNIENAHKSNVEENFETIHERFGVEDAIICEVLSKDNDNFINRNNEYFNRFSNLKSIRNYVKSLCSEKDIELNSNIISNITFKIAMIKICDRIHNLRTMNKMKITKIQEKIDETRRYILPVAIELGSTHPKILNMLHEAIIAAERQIVRLGVEKSL